MNDFGYTAVADPKTATDQVVRLKQAGFIAGGTTMLDLMKLGVEHYENLIDINQLPLTGIKTDAAGLRIGALERMSDVGGSAVVTAHCPAVAQSLLASASPQLRNMASMGGNLLQRTRCYYFRDTDLPCNKRLPGSGCPAQDDHNRNLAILGGSSACIATNAGDMAVAMIALDSVIQIRTVAGGIRTVPLVDFYRLPEQTPWLETVLQPGELIVAITVPKAEHARKSHYLKIRDRASYAFALVSAAVGLDVEDGRIKSARLALGGVGTRPWRLPKAEAALVGKPANEATFRAAATVAMSDAQPRKESHFKIDLAQRTLVRALTTVSQLA